MVSFCVFHLVCFLCTAPHSCLPSYTCFLSLFFVLRIFPLSFPLNTVLEIIHSILFWQLLLNFISHVQLKRTFCVSCLGLIIFGCLQSYSCCHIFIASLYNSFLRFHLLFTPLSICPALCFSPHCSP